MITITGISDRDRPERAVGMRVGRFFWPTGVPVILYTGMQVYLFASQHYPSVSAFSADKDGGNLPPAYSPRRPANDGRALFVGSPGDPIIAAIRACGYFLLAAGGHSGKKGKKD